MSDLKDKLLTCDGVGKPEKERILNSILERQSMQAKRIADLECDIANIKAAALAVIKPIMDSSDVHPCDQDNDLVKARACGQHVAILYRLST